MTSPTVRLRLNQVILLLLSPVFLFPTPTLAFWRLLCHGQLGVARMDPIVSFGNVSQHAHAVHGAQSFSLTSTAETLMKSNCTSCAVVEDRSVYWTPALYFQHENSSFELVPQVGGMTAYYFTNATDATFNITAFPPGFKMIAGDFRRRNFTWPVPDPPMSFWEPSDMTQRSLAAKAIGFNCLHYDVEDEGSLMFHYMRNKTFLDTNCTDGLRLELMFPSCWNGVDLDSADHQSHMRYPDLIKYGDCPDGFHVRTPILFYETIWDTYHFVNVSGQFVFAYGDITGYGYHGDFISGWNQTFLQNAIDTCTNANGEEEDCPLFTIQDDSQATSCKMDLPEPLQNEDVTGPLSSLPGNVPIQYGPAYASIFHNQAGLHSTGTTISVAETTSISYINLNTTDSANTTTLSPSSVVNLQPIPSLSPVLNTSPMVTISATLSTSPALITGPPAEPVFLTSTSTFMSDGVEVFLVIVEEITTVTVTQSTTMAVYSAAKRHLHKHAREGRRI